VRDIVDMRERDGVVEYKVLWLNYSNEDFSWEPKGNINAPKALLAFEQRQEGRGVKKRKRGVAMEFCGLQVRRDLACADDQPAWFIGGLDSYMGRCVRVKRDGELFEGKVVKYVMSAAPGETNVPAVFEIAGTTVSLGSMSCAPHSHLESMHVPKRAVDDGLKLYADSQRSMRGRRGR